jgi:tRNA nucleotidyltransferase (CCA-adding enzyme)
VRFEQRFGFRIEQRTLELLREAVPLLERVSGDRVRHELDHILVEARLEEVLSRLDELKLLQAIHPGLVLDDWFRKCLKLVRSAPKEQEWPREILVNDQSKELLYILWLLRLPEGITRGVIARLKFSATLARTLSAARELWVELPSLKKARPSAVVNRLDGVPMQAIHAVYIACEQADLRQVLVGYIARLSKVKSTINGHDLRLRGLAPGPEYRVILKALRDAWLDGEVSTKEQERDLLSRLLVSINNHG